MGDVLRTFIPHPLISTEDNARTKLTRRETEILQLLVNGFSYKGISLNLNIAIDTVRSHIKKIYEKLKVNSKAEAIIKALKENVTVLS